MVFENIYILIIKMKNNFRQFSGGETSSVFILITPFLRYLFCTYLVNSLQSSGSSNTMTGQDLKTYVKTNCQFPNWSRYPLAEHSISLTSNNINDDIDCWHCTDTINEMKTVNVRLQKITSKLPKAQWIHSLMGCLQWLNADWAIKN